jgi:hypothetical protein
VVNINTRQSNDTHAPSPARPQFPEESQGNRKHLDAHSYAHKHEQGPSLSPKKVSLCLRFLCESAYFVGSKREHRLPPVHWDAQIGQQMVHREEGEGCPSPPQE